MHWQSYADSSNKASTLCLQYSQMTALHLACQNDRREVVSALLEGGAVCNLPDSVSQHLLCV